MSYRENLEQTCKVKRYLKTQIRIYPSAMDVKYLSLKKFNKRRIL